MWCGRWCRCSDELGVRVGAGGPPPRGQPPVAATRADSAHAAEHQADGHGGRVHDQVAEPARQPQVVVDHHSSSSSAPVEFECCQAEGHLRHAHSVGARGDDYFVHDTALPVNGMADISILIQESPWIFHILLRVHGLVWNLGITLLKLKILQYEPVMRQIRSNRQTVTLGESSALVYGLARVAAVGLVEADVVVGGKHDVWLDVLEGGL